MERFCVETPRFSICVAAECSRTLGLIRRHLLPWLPRGPGSDRPADVDVILRRTSEVDRFGVEINGTLVAASEAMPYAFTLIQQAVDDATIGHLQDETAIHAGVVVHGGRAIVMPGPSGAGKSHLVQELLRHGAEYCSDEYAILDSTGYVHPYPRALMIRQDGDAQQPVLASELPARVCDHPIPVSLFVFLRYGAGSSGLNLRPLDRGESLIRLLQNTPQVLAEKPHILTPVAAALSLASSYEGVRGEGSIAAAELLRLEIL